MINYISKWRSGRQLSDTRWLEVIKGHLRSNNSKNCQISNYDEIWSIIYQNDALDVSFLTQGGSRSYKVKWGQRTPKTVKFRTMIKYETIIYQNDASDVSFLIQGVSRSLKATWGQNFEGKSNFLIISNDFN